MRVGATNNAETTIGILNSTWRPQADMLERWQFPIRLVETDAAPANSRAEEIESTASHWRLLHSHCVGHKVHGAAQKCWSLCLPELKGMTRTLLCFQQPHFLEKFKQEVGKIVRSKAKLVTHSPTLTAEAEHFRVVVLQAFGVSSRSLRGRRRLEAFADLLGNGDWRDKRFITHFCRGPHCCGSRDELCAKLTTHLCALLKALQPVVINRANWLKWHQPLGFLGTFLAFHGLLEQAMVQVFEQQDNCEEDVAPDDGDVTAAWRVEAKENARISLEWLQGGAALDSVLRLRLCLDPEINLMSKVIKNSVPAVVTKQSMTSSLAGEHNHTPSVVLANGRVLQEFFSSTSTLLQQDAATCWQSLPPTEEEATKIFQLTMKAAAAVYVNVFEVWKRWPLRLFLLLDPERRQAVAAALHSAPECTLDKFTAAWRHDFASTEALLSPRCQQLLSALTSTLQTTTWSTEATHARNARRARARIHTHRCDLQTLATMHTATTVPEWQASLQKLEAEALDIDSEALLVESLVIWGFLKTQKQKKKTGYLWSLTILAGAEVGRHLCVCVLLKPDQTSLTIPNFHPPAPPKDPPKPTKAKKTAHPPQASRQSFPLQQQSFKARHFV